VGGALDLRDRVRQLQQHGCHHRLTIQITVTPTELEGVAIVETAYFEDRRGFFIESWVRREYAAAGIDVEFVQDNHSRSAAGVLRGLHFQDLTAPMGKLVRCTRGAVFDVAVDLRVGSPTFGRHVAAELTEANKRQLWVPPGFAHGFLALADPTDVQYKCSGYYTPAAEGAVRWDDPDLAIPWPVEAPTLSAKDARAPSLRDYLSRPAFRHQG
jgi:dTDP-4-dehydrorhamnose 3,5-epimerase